MDKERVTVLVDRRTFSAIMEAIRQYHVTYTDMATANAGLENLVIWGGPVQDSAVILIAGES